jgi:hypothetical protein
MREQQQDECERRGRTLLEGKHGVCAGTGEEGLRSIRSETSRSHAVHGPQSSRSESGER